MFEQPHKYKINGLNFFKNTMYMHPVPSTKLKSLKEKNTHHIPSHA